MNENTVKIINTGKQKWKVIIGNNPAEFEFEGVDLGEVMGGIATWVALNTVFARIQND